jgi:hypothetical protein
VDLRPLLRTLIASGCRGAFTVEYGQFPRSGSTRSTFASSWPPGRCGWFDVVPALAATWRFLVVGTRYRMPLVPMLAIAAGAGLNAFLDLRAGEVRVFEQTPEDSLTDPVTDLQNMRFMFIHLMREFARCERSPANLRSSSRVSTRAMAITRGAKRSRFDMVPVWPRGCDPMQRRRSKRSTSQRQSQLAE